MGSVETAATLAISVAHEQLCEAVELNRKELSQAIIETRQDLVKFTNAITALRYGLEQHAAQLGAIWQALALSAMPHATAVTVAPSATISASGVGAHAEVAPL